MKVYALNVRNVELDKRFYKTLIYIWVSILIVS